MFIILYLVMCLLWTIFCVKVQHRINGHYLVKDGWVIVLNFVFAPVSLIMGIARINKDFSPRQENKEGVA